VVFCQLSLGALADIKLHHYNMIQMYIVTNKSLTTAAQDCWLWLKSGAERETENKYTQTQPFYSPFFRTTRVSWCEKKSSRLYGAREDNRGRRTDHPAGHHSIWTNQWPTSIVPIFTPDALPDAALPIYPGLGQAPNVLACIPSGCDNPYTRNLLFPFSCLALVQRHRHTHTQPVG